MGFTNQYIIYIVLGQSLFRIEARWRLVYYLNDLLSELERKLASDKFEEVCAKRILNCRFLKDIPPTRFSWIIMNSDQ